MTTDTIVAKATASGIGGVGIIRISGSKAQQVALEVTGTMLTPRMATYASFKDQDGSVIDQGIALFFNNPNSFTGEDVLELQGHGGTIVMDMLIKRILTIDGVRMARAGEFSERAFLNDKIDLAQAEAIADLIEASSEQAAKSALQSLQGKFSQKINELVASVINLRVYVEAAIDFPEEEIDFLSDGKISGDLQTIIDSLEEVRQAANHGAIMRDGMKVVIAGKPNAGKSSLLNALVGKESAIVTDIAGTTRDVLREHIHIDGMPLHIIDTAGLRNTNDTVEKIGIQRAWNEISQADRILFMIDSVADTSTNQHDLENFIAKLPPNNIGITIIRNKADQSCEPIEITTLQLPTSIKNLAHNELTTISLSAKTGAGVELLREHLKECMGFSSLSGSENSFMARRRHLEALNAATNHLLIGKQQLESSMSGEILAEELRITQEYLNEITGEFKADDLLGKIFSSFCIGK